MIFGGSEEMFRLNEGKLPGNGKLRRIFDKAKDPQAVKL